MLQRQEQGSQSLGFTVADFWKQPQRRPQSARPIRPRVRPAPLPTPEHANESPSEIVSVGGQELRLRHEFGRYRVLVRLGHQWWEFSCTDKDSLLDESVRAIQRQWSSPKLPWERRKPKHARKNETNGTADGRVKRWRQ